jgi:hypothetical protein
MKTEKAEALKQKQEAEFASFLERVPPGERTSDEQVTALRTAYFENPQSLYAKVTEWAQKLANLPGKTGTRQVAIKQSEGDEKPARRYAEIYGRK